MRTIFVTLLLLAFLPTAALGQTSLTGVGQGWMPEFNHAARQLVALAEATPAEKFAWSPGKGVRSVAGVYMHIAVANYYFVSKTGAKMPANAQAILKDNFETTITAKAEVIRYLKMSLDLVRETYPKANLKAPVKFLDQDSTVENVYLRCIIHNNEHMGQSIAYARMIGVVPPWSQ